MAPEDQLEAAKRAARLSPGATKALGELLSPTVLAPMTQELATQLSQFCLRHELAEADLGHVLKVVRWLVCEAASRNLRVSELREDLGVLWPERGDLADVIATHYPALCAQLRAQLVSDALLKHGEILVDVDWRIDRLDSSRHATQFDVPIAMVTLAHKNAAAAGRLTLQLTSAELSRLAAIFSALSQKTQLMQQESGAATSTSEPPRTPSKAPPEATETD